MITYTIADERHIELLMAIRLEMLKVVNSLPVDYEYDSAFIAATRQFFLNGNQTTVLAMDTEKGTSSDAVIGCATMVYVEFMPTFSHPTGHRAHLMNVYTNDAYRRQGIGKRMVQSLIDEARAKGCTEISLDATDMGRPLYKRLGFTESDSCMFMNM